MFIIACHFLCMQLQFDIYSYKSTQTLIADLFVITTGVCSTVYESVNHLRTDICNICNIFVILKPKFPWKGFHFELLKQNMIKYWKELDQLYEQSLQSSQRHQNSCAKCEYILSKWLHSLKYWVLLSSNSKIQTYLTILHKLVCSCLA